MNFSTFPELDLPPLPENPVMDFDLFGNFGNQDMFNPGTFDNLLPDSTGETTTASLDRKLEDICARLGRIEEGMATKDQLDQVATSIDHGFECLTHAVSDAMQSVDKLRNGLRYYTMMFLKSIGVSDGGERSNSDVAVKAG
ncbi:hypothetical protein PG990_001593 [Apiospora arundinis]|uniref:Uncharacterized protein n=1 Tax=Apiospora arundinis TaxID=335852 RepID=A0ABR2HRS6_9PEZI